MKNVLVMFLLSLSIFQSNCFAINKDREQFNETLQLFMRKYQGEMEKQYVMKCGRSYNVNLLNKVIFAPPLEPDKRIYFTGGKIERKSGDKYLVKEVSGGNVYYLLFIDKIWTENGKENLRKLRLNGGVGILGRMVGFFDYQTVGGESKQMPVFEAYHAEACTPYFDASWNCYFCAY